MYHAIEKISPIEIMDDNNKPVKLNGYAFMDEIGNCIIIRYGEGNRDAMSKYLNSEGEDLLGLKYKIVNLLP